MFVTDLAKFLSNNIEDLQYSVNSLINNLTLLSIVCY